MELQDEMIFGQPLCYTHDDSFLTEDILNFIKDLPKKANTHNGLSQENYVFDNYPELEPIASFCLKAVSKYYHGILGAPDVTKPCITQSWFTYSKRGEKMHGHTHPNSLVSGVYYINAKRDVDKLILLKTQPYDRIQFSQTHVNQYTGRSYTVPVGTGDLVLFPSETFHEFNEVEHDEFRISLAFNTFPAGTIGSKQGLTELRI